MRAADRMRFVGVNSRERFVVIPTGADLPPVAQAEANHANGTVIASVGRLERYKGHHRLIAALPQKTVCRRKQRVSP